MATWKSNPIIIKSEYPDTPDEVLRVELQTTCDQLIIYQNGEVCLRTSSEALGPLAKLLGDWAKSY